MPPSPASPRGSISICRKVCANPPLLVWVHGGAWSAGSKEQYPEVFVTKGFALASLDFRQSTEARFPANVHDIKAAIRYLRAHAAEYGYRADRIAIAGASSGAHLAALVGVTNGNAQLEGTPKAMSLKQSSAVQAIVSYFGASNLNTILAQSTPVGVNVREPALTAVAGRLAARLRCPELATLASPVSHVSKASPPLLLFHWRIRMRRCPSTSRSSCWAPTRSSGWMWSSTLLHGAAHGGNVFFEGEALG